MAAQPASLGLGARSTPKEVESINFTIPQPLVTLIVDKGPSRSTFFIHKNLISYHSPFFATAFSSNFVEGEAQSMTLEDVDSKTFGSLVHWMYTQNREVLSTNGLEPVDKAKLYLLAQRFLVTPLEKTLLAEINCNLDNSSALLESESKWQEFRNFAYSPIVEDKDSPLRKIAVSATIKFLSKETTQSVIDSLPEGMHIDFTKAMAEGCAALPGWEKGLGFSGLAERMEMGIGVHDPYFDFFEEENPAPQKRARMQE